MEMLCSLSTTKPASSWLERLRVSKGLPLLQPDLDLDHFLKHPDNPSPDAEECNHDVPVDDRPRHSVLNRSKKGIVAKEELSSALADLFHMENPNEDRKLTVGKSCRKQLNPKICVPSSKARQGGGGGGGGGGGFAVALSPPSAANSAVGAKKRRNSGGGGSAKKGKKKGSHGRGSGDFDRKLYSRIDVTVIDTSSEPDWKSQKIIFRKGTVWKVRDKKMWILSRKKRKSNAGEKIVGEKERGEERQADGNQINDAERPLSPKERNTPASISKGGACDDHISVLKRRFPFPKAPRRPSTKDPSVTTSGTVACKKSSLCCPEVE